jgi:hypothetical protein
MMVFLSSVLQGDGFHGAALHRVAARGLDLGGNRIRSYDGNGAVVVEFKDFWTHLGA